MFASWIRIYSVDPDLDPELKPAPNLSERLAPNQHRINAGLKDEKTFSLNSTPDPELNPDLNLSERLAESA
jgi:hypothetical protein